MARRGIMKVEGRCIAFIYTKMTNPASNPSEITRKRVGRPRKEFSLSYQLRDYLIRNPSKAYKIIKSWVDMVIVEHNPQALKELLERLEGKVVEKRELDVRVPVNLILQPFPRPNELDSGQVVEGEYKELSEGVRAD